MALRIARGLLRVWLVLSALWVAGVAFMVGQSFGSSTGSKLWPRAVGTHPIRLPRAVRTTHSTSLRKCVTGCLYPPSPEEYLAAKAAGPNAKPPRTAAHSFGAPIFSRSCPGLPVGAWIGLGVGLRGLSVVRTTPTKPPAEENPMPSNTRVSALCCAHAWRVWMTRSLMRASTSSICAFTRRPRSPSPII